MKKRIWIAVGVLLMIVVCVSLWQYNTFKNEKIEVMCKSSVNGALEHFQKFETDGKESDYIAGVAEFRAYMTAYLCLADGVSDTDYIWCNTLYGDMILHPEQVKVLVPELVEALEYLAEDYDHPNGFNRIHALNNQLKTE